MSRLPLQTLPAFRAVARLSSVRAAADQLHLTHSAVSQQIRLLEEQLGHSLFERSGKRLAINAAGSALLAAVEGALDQLDDGVRAASAAASGRGQLIRVTLLPSFAQRWLIPRLGRWRTRHPGIAIELHSAQRLVDLQREGFHAALRQGEGPWRGLEAERLIDSPLIALGSPAAARRLQGVELAAWADEPLLGEVELWERFFEIGGARLRVKPVADFNDSALMLQATEQDIGIALARELLAADAVREGRLVRLSPLSITDDETHPYWLVYPGALRDWPPLAALRQFLVEELAASQREVGTAVQPASALVPPPPAAIVAEPAGPAVKETAPGDRSGSQSQAPSGARAARRTR